MRVGYIRVSTVDQHTDRQLDGIVDTDRLFTEKASGKDVARPQFDELIRFVRDGDTVVVHSMDRLARNLEDLRRIVRTLTDKGVSVEFVNEHLTFTGDDSPMANLMLSVMGAFAEFERALLRERQAEGIAKAKQRGVYRGRKKSLAKTRSAHSSPAPLAAKQKRRWPRNLASAAKPSTPTFGPSPHSLRWLVCTW
jgi:DNA invertase Pin-like site-specific DNA recombinase